MPPPLDSTHVVASISGAAAGYALRMLATLGADAVLIEPEGGSPLRREPPYLPGTSTSALFAYLSAGSRIQTGGLEEALANADIFIHDTPVSEREALGLTDAALAARFANLIPVSVLPFGAHGPKAHWKGEDINIIHASGEGYLLPNGLTVEQFPDRPPVKPYGHFAEYQGGVAAALGALTALAARDASGAQAVDVSSQDAALAVGAFAIQRLGDGQVEHRVERSFRYGGVIKCADGFVELLTLEQRQWDGLVQLLGNPDWAEDPALSDNIVRSRRGPAINRHIRAWAASRCVDDVVREGQKLSVPLARYMTPGDVLADRHERHRGLFQSVEVPGVGPLDMLVSPFHFDGKPLTLNPPRDCSGRGTTRAASGGGAVASQTKPSESTPPPPFGWSPSPCKLGEDLPLSGLRIADFTVHNAGPFATHMLGQLGAEIIKIESAMRPDAFRKPHPVYGREGPATFDQVASGKLSVRLILKDPEGVALAKRIVAVCDVASESFRPGVIGRLGLGYAALKAVKRDIVMLSVSSCGQDGPDSHFAGYAPLFGAWGGLSHLTGYADGPPVEMRHVMDHTVGMHAAVALIAALHLRAHTGNGCHVDVAAREVASSLIGEALLMAAAGASPQRMGNDHPRMDPHGVYACRGEDRWLSVAVADDRQRATLAAVTGGLELDVWAKTQGANAAAELLQAAGIAAHASWTTPEIAADPHLRARGAIVSVREPDGKQRAAVGVPMRLSASPGIGIARGTPELGQDEEYVFGELLGIGRAERARLEEEKVIY